jgi:hypothetical protein
MMDLPSSAGNKNGRGEFQDCFWGSEGSDRRVPLPFYPKTKEDQSLET